MGAEDFQIGKIAPRAESRAAGTEGFGYGTDNTQTVTNPNAGYNSFTVNNTNNQNQFLSITAHGNSVKFSTATISNTYGDDNYVGGNRLSSENTMRERYAQEGSGTMLFGMA